MPTRLFEMLALAGYFLASLLALAAQLNPRAARERHAVALSLTAFVLHTLALALPALSGRFDLKIVFLAVGWGVYLVTGVAGSLRRARLGALQAVSYPLCALIFAAAVMQPEQADFASYTGLAQRWFLAHVVALVSGIVLCAAAALYSALYLLEDRRLRAHGATAGGTLPALETADRLAIRFLGAGFAALSFGIFAGIALLRDPQEAHPPGDLVIGVTLALWALSLLVILARAAGALSGRRSAWLQLLAALLAALAVGALRAH